MTCMRRPMALRVRPCRLPISLWVIHSKKYRKRISCYDLCRKYRPITDLSEVQDFLPADDPDPTERLSLWEAVLSLNPEMRSVVTLFYYDGFSIREISRTLGISDVAVKTRLSRSRKQLRLLLADEQGGVYGSI